MARRTQQKRRMLAEINVVPYIDVMLVLLVIFMITAPLLSQGVHVNLPKAKAKAISMKQEVPIVVTVDKQGRYYVNASPTPAVPVNAQQLVNLIAAEEAVNKQAGKHVPVYVKGDTAVDYGKVVQAMVLLQQAGVSRVGLLTKDPQGQRVNHAV